MFRRSDIVKNNSLHEEIAQKLKIVTPLPVDHFRFEILHFECQKRDQEGGFSQNPLAVRENRLKLKNSGLTSGLRDAILDLKNGIRRVNLVKMHMRTLKSLNLSKSA
jgi:hypothetical protein